MLQVARADTNTSKTSLPVPQRSFGKDITNIIVNTIVILPLQTAQIVGEKKLPPESNCSPILPPILSPIQLKLAEFEKKCKSQSTVESQERSKQQLYRTLRESEEKTSSSGLYMVCQDISENDRSVLVNFMVLAHEKLELNHATLHLAVNIVDRYLETTRVEKYQLQLLGIVAMSTAAKFQEGFYRPARMFKRLGKDIYDSVEILKQENDILGKLGFELCAVTALDFIDVYQMDPECRYFAEYFAEICLLDYGMLRFLPSRRAAAAVFLAEKLTGGNRACFDYKESDIVPCAKRIVELIQKYNQNGLGAVIEKYSRAQYKSVALIDIFEKTFAKQLMSLIAYTIYDHHQYWIKFNESQDLFIAKIRQD